MSEESTSSNLTLLSLLLNPGTGNSRLVHTNLYGRSRLYIKQHFSHPPVNQSVAITYLTDGLQTRNLLTVFTSIANIYTTFPYIY